MVSATTRNAHWCSLTGCRFCWERRLWGTVCFHPFSLRLSHLLIHPMLPFAIKPGSYTCYTTTGVSCLQRAYAWMKFLAHDKKNRTLSSDQLCTDTVFSSFFEKKKLIRLQALAKSQNWPACWTSVLENKIGYFWKFLLDTFLPFIQILRNGHSF